VVKGTNNDQGTLSRKIQGKKKKCQEERPGPQKRGAKESKNPRGGNTSARKFGVAGSRTICVRVSVDRGKHTRSIGLRALGGGGFSKIIGGEGERRGTRVQGGGGGGNPEDPITE